MGNLRVKSSGDDGQRHTPATPEPMTYTRSISAYRNGSGCGDELGATSFTIP